MRPPITASDAASVGRALHPIPWRADAGGGCIAATLGSSIPGPGQARSVT
jgi:hypothetical protein